MIKKIFGPPGTGKTSYLLDVMEREMENGIEPDRIAFVSFTRKAAKEAIQRAVDLFRLRQSDFPYFQTLHSMAYRMLGLRHDEVMQVEHYREIGSLLGIEFSFNADFADGLTTSSFKGDQYVYLDGYARTKKMTHYDAWHKLDDLDVDWDEFVLFKETLIAYKREHGLHDFSDFLEQYHEPIDVDVAIIDEAQDLSTLQWQFALTAFRNVQRLYIAGDDDQAIYAWSGADVRAFLGVPGETVVLDQSWRIPQAVHSIANEVVGRISNRLPKDYKPSERIGAVEYYRYIDDVDGFNNDTWLLLARNTYHLAHLSKLMRDHGHIFNYRNTSSINKQWLSAIISWEAKRKGAELMLDEIAIVKSVLDPAIKDDSWPDRIWHEVLTGIPHAEREYYISVLRRGEKITREPRISINTIHGVKGGEADHVMLLTDMTTKTYAGFQRFPDSEHRVWYVGATRCKESLHVVLPQTKLAYDI